MGSHDFGGIGSCEGPNDVASCVTNVSPDRVITQIDIIDKSFFKYRHELVESTWKQQTSPAELCKG